MVRFILILLFVLGFSTKAFACCGGGLGLEDGLFWNTDLNRDQQITIDEAKRLGNYNLSSPEVFAKYDTSGEGVIIFPEFLHYLRVRRPNE